MDCEDDRFFVNIGRRWRDKATPITLFSSIARGLLHSPLPMLRRRIDVWKEASEARWRNTLLTTLVTLSSLSTMTLLFVYLFFFRDRNKAEQQKQPKYNWQWSHHRQTDQTDNAHTFCNDDPDFPSVCEQPQSSSASDYAYKDRQQFMEFKLALANAIKSGELTFFTEEAMKFTDHVQRDRVRDLLFKTFLLDCAQQWKMRIAILEVLQHFMDEKTRDMLLETLEDDGDSLVRTATVRTLGAVKLYAPVKALSELLLNKDEPWNVREMAALMLGENAELVYPELLTEAVQDEDEDVRRAVIWALGQLGERAPLPELVKALSDEDEFVRETAAQALWHAGQRGQEALLMAAFSDEQGMVSNVAEEAVGETGANALAKLLMGGFKDGQPFASSPAFVSFLRQRLTTDLEVGNEPKDSPLWLLCTPDDSLTRKTDELPPDADTPAMPEEETLDFDIESFFLDEQSIHLSNEQGASAIWLDQPNSYCIDKRRFKWRRTTEGL